MPRDAKNYLWFLPLLLIISVNLWGGINTSHTTNEILFHIISMINVGFIEEIIFRGFLFKMMAQNGIRSAVIVSALTFGVGHIVNLFNGADVIPTLLQICYAAAIGFLFVIIFLKSGSLIPCIITHCAVNSLSIFSVENETLSYITAAFLTVVPIAYAIYIIKRTEKQQ
jgi:membrane protease YdiL (CAAX protease family)